MMKLIDFCAPSLSSGARVRVCVLACVRAGYFLLSIDDTVGELIEFNVSYNLMEANLLLLTFLPLSCRNTCSSG